MNESAPTTARSQAGRAPTSVQPGGGWCVRLELAWGRLRRAYLRRCRPGYVRRMAGKRQGACRDCPHDVIDARDLKFCRNVCGYSFLAEDDRFRWRGRLGLARYGLAEVLIFTALFALVVGACVPLALHVHRGFWLPLVPAVLLWLEIVYFFRDPERIIPADADVLVSPADGTVTHVEEVDEPDFPGGRALRISIFLSIFNVHVNRMPRTCRVLEVRYFPGLFLDARHPDSALRNEQLWLDLREPSGRELRVKQISGAFARRIVCWLRKGDEVEKGQRLGMIKLGSRTDVLVPVTSAVHALVKPGDKVRGGASMLLRFLDERDERH